MRFSFLGWSALMFGAGCGGETDKTSPETLIRRLCGDLIQLPCWNAENAETQAECEAELQDSRAEAGGEGCLAEFDAVLSCAADHPLSCSEEDNPKIADSCVSHNRAFAQCHDRDEPPVAPPTPGAGGAGGSPECAVGFGSGGTSGGVTCMHQCAGFATRCEGPSQSGPLVCSCTAGPQTGFSFEASDCGPSMIAGSNAFCNTPP